MNYYVYILQSLQDGSLYKGYTTDYKRRLEEHNSGKTHYTSKKVPWKLVYVEQCASKTEALKREKSLKHANGDYLRWLMNQPSNLLLNT